MTNVPEGFVVVNDQLLSVELVAWTEAINAQADAYQEYELMCLDQDASDDLCQICYDVWQEAKTAEQAAREVYEDAKRPQHDATMSRRSCGCESCHVWRHRLDTQFDSVEAVQTGAGFETRRVSR